MSVDQQYIAMPMLGTCVQLSSLIWYIDILNIEDNASDNNDSKVESSKDNKQQCNKLNIEIDKLKYNYETKLQQMNSFKKHKFFFRSFD